MNRSYLQRRMLAVAALPLMLGAAAVMPPHRPAGAQPAYDASPCPKAAPRGDTYTARRKARACGLNAR